MDASPLVLILATSLNLQALPPDHGLAAAPRKASEAAKLDNAKAWLLEHWAQEVQVLERTESCIDKARSWGEIGYCTRTSARRLQLAETLHSSACIDNATPDSGTSGSPGEAAAP